MVTKLISKTLKAILIIALKARNIRNVSLRHYEDFFKRMFQGVKEKKISRY
jgi:hypothetical protein